MVRCLWVMLLGLVLLAGGCASGKKSVDAASLPGSSGERSVDAAKAYEAGQKQRSLEIYRSLVAVNPSDHEALNNMGVILLAQGDVDAAMNAFEKASLLQPSNSQYLVNLGLSHVKDKDYDEAIVFFDRALLQDRKAGGAYHGKGLAFLYLDEPEIALGLFRQATLVDPDNVESLFMKAYAAQKTGLWSDAVADYTLYLRRTFDKVQAANAFSNRAVCFYHLKDFESGMADIEQAMQLNDANPIYYYNRAQGYQMQQDFENAVSDYTRAISRKSNFPEAYINRGELNYLLENVQKGCADLERACDMGYCELYEKYEAIGKCEK